MPEKENKNQEGNKQENVRNEKGLTQEQIQDLYQEREKHREKIKEKESVKKFLKESVSQNIFCNQNEIDKEISLEQIKNIVNIQMTNGDEGEITTQLMESLKNLMVNDKKRKKCLRKKLHLK